VALVVWSVSPPRRVPSVFRTSNTPGVMAHQRPYHGVPGCRRILRAGRRSQRSGWSQTNATC
jgi:hypothetical protein